MEEREREREVAEYIVVIGDVGRGLFYYSNGKCTHTQTYTADTLSLSISLSTSLLGSFSVSFLIPDCKPAPLPLPFILFLYFLSRHFSPFSITSLSPILTCVLLLTGSLVTWVLDVAEVCLEKSWRYTAKLCSVDGWPTSLFSDFVL